MKTQLKIFLSLLMISLLGISTVNSNLFAQKVFEGYWESETITKSTLPMQPANKIEKQKTYFKNGKMKTVNTTDNTTIIYRFDKGVAWTLDRKNKTYNEMHFDQLQAGMKNAKNKMAQAMKEMDPEEREMMKKMMGGKMGAMMGQSEEPAISFNHTGKKKTIKGYSCSQVIMNLGDEPMMEMWMTNKFNLGNDFLKIYQKMGLIKSDIPKNSKLKGFPIYTTMNMDMGIGKVKSETTVIKISKTKISDSEFSLPKGYKKLDNPMPF